MKSATPLLLALIALIAGCGPSPRVEDEEAYRTAAQASQRRLEAAKAATAKNPGPLFAFVEQEYDRVAGLVLAKSAHAAADLSAFRAYLETEATGLRAQQEGTVPSTAHQHLTAGFTDYSTATTFLSNVQAAGALGEGDGGYNAGQAQVYAAKGKAEFAACLSALAPGR